MSYTLGKNKNGEAYILCHTCNLKSYNPHDIAQKYCGHCHVFHERVPTSKELLKTPIVIETDVATAVCIIGSLQLAGRHPANTGASRKQADIFARALEEAVALKFPELKDVLELGWNPEFDVDA